MRLNLGLNIGSGIRDPFGPYTVGGNSPQLVAGCRDNFYASGSERSTFDDLFTFSRASTATYVDSSGTLQTAASGEARLNHHVYENGQWVNKGLLLESEARTNSVLDNRDFSTANWNNNGSEPNPTKNAVGIDGQENSAWTLTDDTALVYTQMEQTITIPDDSNTHVASCYIRKNSASSNNAPGFRVDLLGGGTELKFSQAGVNTATGAVVGDNTTNGANVEDAGDFWRLWFTVTNNGTGNTTLSFRVYPAACDTTGTYAATVTGSAVFDAPQVELNAHTPSSPIITNGSTVTRAAENLTIAAADLPYDGTAMTVSIEGAETYADEDTAGQVELFDWRADANNRITLTLDTDSTKTGTLTLTMVNGGTSTTISQGGLSPDVLESFNVAFAVTDTALRLAVNGTAATEVTHTVGIPDLSAASAEFGGNGTRALERAWGGVALSNSQLEEATS